MAAWPELQAPMPMLETARHSVFEKGNELAAWGCLCFALQTACFELSQNRPAFCSTLTELERIHRFDLKYQ